MPYQYYPCKVVRVQSVTECIRIYHVEYPESHPPIFKAGQFVMFDLPIDSRVTNRSYSIASAPDSTRILEFLIVLNPDGMGTNHLFSNVMEGNILLCSMPLGKFSLPEHIDRELCFVCTGTGVAPFRSMIFDIFNRNLPHQKITLIYGARKICDLAYYQEFDALQQQHPEFKFIPVLSREDAPIWNGEKGYVHQVYQKLFKEKLDTYFYLCGFGNMLREARENLAQMGIAKNHIKFESYD